MPSRRITLAIVAFWLIMAGLFVVQDVWPRLVQAEPQMFPADIVDEAGRQSDDLVKWLVFKNGGGGYRAETEWKYHSGDNSFESHCDLKRQVDEDEPDKGGQIPPLSLFQFRRVVLKDSYFLTRAGRLIRLETTADYNLVLSGPASESVAIRVQETGEQSAGRFVQHHNLYFPSPDGKERLKELQLGPLSLGAFQRDEAAVTVPGHGLVLDPLHPPRRIPNLTPGQRWRVAVFDPFAAVSLVAPLWPERDSLPDAGVSFLAATVLPDVETLLWDDQHGNAVDKSEEVKCRVIECRGTEPVRRLAIWMRERDGLPFKQEAEVWGDIWTFWRRDQASPMTPARRFPNQTKP